MASEQTRIQWKREQGVLRAFEPSADEVRTHAAALAAAYNEPYNRSMMGHGEMSEQDVREHFAESAQAGGRLFLLELDGALMGDADFRNLETTQAEFAIMIGGRGSQGKGLGTQFALMLHAFAFRTLKLRKVYITVLHNNAASRRLFEKLGYRVDTSADIRAHVDDESDVAMSIGRAEFERIHEAALAQIEL